MAEAKGGKHGNPNRIARECDPFEGESEKGDIAIKDR